MNMNLTMLKNDFKRNKAGNVALLLFITLAASLVVVATIVVTMLMTSMTEMYKTARPPHFLQMHKGEIQQSLIDDFNSSYTGVTAWQTVPMIDVYGDDLKLYEVNSKVNIDDLGNEKFNLSECRLDISFVKQNKEYDLLLDNSRNIIKVKSGEIGIPVILLEAYPFKLGDTVVLTNHGITKEFKVTAFVHDAQMNSTLCSSTRILISDEDFDELFGKVGEIEYLIEAYFVDSSLAADYQTAYEQAGLPQEGQAVTYSIIFLLSALRDIAMAMVLILVSILLILVALLCTKYTIMAALEEEISEIGTMKAIGIAYKDIRDLYLKKYNIIVLVGIILGYVIALIISNIFTGHVNNTFGKQPLSILTLGLPLVACVFLYFVTSHYCKRLLRKLKKVTVVDALVTGKGFGKKERVQTGLHKSKRMPVNVLLSIGETFHNFEGYIIVFLVMFIVSGITIVPMNLINTMKSKEFIPYMGSSMDDILIEIDSGENLEKKFQTMINLLKQDTEIKEYMELRRVRIEALNSEDEWVNLHVDCGYDAGNELKYLTGKSPSYENEIALSKLNAEAMGKKIGESIIVRYNDIKKEFKLSGIYQDVTSGGFTAKAFDSFPEVISEKYQLTVNLQDRIDAKEKSSKWSDQLGGGYVIQPMEEFLDQTLGGVARQVEVATTAVVFIGILLAALIVVLFMKLRLAKDVAQIATMKAIGFTNSDVRRQYLYKIGMVSILGILAGTVISNILGEALVSAAFGMMGLGITKITFIINPWMAFVVLPLVLLAVAAVMTWMSARQIKNYHIISLINE